MIRCKTCEKQTNNKTYCSYRCRNIGYIGTRETTKVVFCKICNKETSNKTYCSEKCQHIGSKMPKIAREQRTCIFCKNDFLIRQTKKNKYCSRKCVDKDKKNIMIGNKNSYSHTEEWKDKMSIFMKNKWKDIEYVEKILTSRQEASKLLDYPIGHDHEATKKRKESIKKYSLEKYGTEHPFSSKQYREESEKICIDKYGKTSREMAREKIDKEVVEKRRRTLIETIHGISYEEYEKKLSQKEKYYKEVRRISENQPLHLLENYDKRGVCEKDGYHLDHIIPISYGFINNIPPEIIGDISNLQFIYWLENIQKGSKHEEKDQIRKKLHKKIYPGSTIQQNHGETDDKGFLIWEIEDKNKFDVRHVVIPHPRPFITIKLDENGKFDESVNIKPDSRIRVVCEHNVPVSDIRKTIDVIKVKYIPESVTFLNKATDRIDISDTIKKIDTDDLRNLQTQEKLLREYLKDFNPSEEVLQKVFEINKKYNSIAEENEEVSRNVRWSLKSLKWDNLFNYGTGNKIDFDKLEGVIGIFGKNFSGKSSIIDSLLWGIQNSTSKNVRKNVNIINQNQQSAKAEVEIIVDDKLYMIERTAEKYLKKLAGEETLEAKTDVSFSMCDVDEGEDCVKFEKGNLNGLDRNETDKNIRKIFGTLEDFLFTSMASQMGSLDFINEGSTRRKEILGKFLDLELFAKKYKLSNNDATELKASLKRLESKDYDKEIAETLIHGAESKKQAESQTSECEEIKEEIKVLTEDINKINIDIASMPKIEVVDVDSVKSSLKKTEDDIESWHKIIASNTAFIEDKQKALDNASQVIANIKIEELNKKKELLTQKNKELDKVLRDLSDAEKDILRDQKAIKILDEVPCGDSFPTCKFLTDAFQKKSDLENKNELVNITNKKKQQISKDIEDLNPTEIEKSITARNLILEKIRNMENLISSKKLESEQYNGKIIVSQSLIEKLEAKIENYYKNEADAVKIKELNDKKQELVSEKTKLSKKLAECEASILKLHREYGSLEQKHTDLQASKAELLKLREEYAAIAMFEKAMHSNGISYDIIRKKLPVINEEIAKILSNIVNFEIFFEDDGKKLDILIKHPKYDARPLELCSGAEKSLAAMAIRLALTKLTTLPVSSLFILDEPATALDEENMEGFMRIIDMLKAQFKTIILISHLPELKDVADLQITIDNVEGYAHVEV